MLGPLVSAGPLVVNICVNVRRALWVLVSVVSVWLCRLRVLVVVVLV